MPDEYDVGYKKPPKHGQYQPGQSGNPKGRPKGSKDLRTELQEELAEIIRIKEGGQAKAVSKQRAMLKSLTAKAVHGDTRAANLVVGMIFKLLHDRPDDGDGVELTPTDRAILAEFEANVLEAAQIKGQNDDE